MPDTTNIDALIELGNLALAGGFRSAAKTANAEAIRHHPANAVAPAARVLSAGA